MDAESLASYISSAAHYVERYDKGSTGLLSMPSEIIPYARALVELSKVTFGSWSPMSTAPLDGTEVVLLVERRAGVTGCMLVGHYMPGGHCIEDHPPIDRGWYFWTGTAFDVAAKPLRWMPLPKVPT